MRLLLKLRAKKLTKSMLDILVIFTTQMNSTIFTRILVLPIQYLSILDFQLQYVVDGGVYETFLISVRYLKHFTNPLANSYDLVQVYVFFTRISKLYRINLSEKIISISKTRPISERFYSVTFFTLLQIN